jgi:hypothetical protein
VGAAGSILIRSRRMAGFFMRQTGPEGIHAHIFIPEFATRDHDRHSSPVLDLGYLHSGGPFRTGEMGSDPASLQERAAIFGFSLRHPGDYRGGGYCNSPPFRQAEGSKEEKKRRLPP